MGRWISVDAKIPEKEDLKDPWANYFSHDEDMLAKENTNHLNHCYCHDIDFKDGGVCELCSQNPEDIINWFADVICPMNADEIMKYFTR